MLKNIILLSVLFFGNQIFILAQVEDDLPCQHYDPVKDFDQDKFKGTWIAYKKTVSEADVENTKCVRYVFGDIEGDKWHTSQQYVDEDDDSKHELRNTITIKKPAALVRKDGREFIILSTDYDNYAVLYGSKELEDSCSITIHILTRKENVSIEDKITARDVKDVVNNYNDDMELKDQDNCPTDWSDVNASEDDRDFKTS